MRATTALALVASTYVASAYNLAVSNTGGNTTSPYQYGLMFEDINHSGDGGIYAELVQNRAFQAFEPAQATLAPWSAVSSASLALDTSNPLSSALPVSVKVTPESGSSTAGLSNPGWWGISVTPQKYTGQFHVRGTYSGSITVSLVSNTTSTTLASTTVAVKSKKNSWNDYSYTLSPTDSASDVNNYLEISFSSAEATDGSLNFNLISLFPPTYNNRKNGMRIDLMEALNALSPSFLRMPGGNNLEGNGPAPMYGRWAWNETIGPLKNRPGRWGTWGYFNTDGLGLNEYLDWCVDLDMAPILAVWDGHYLNGDVISSEDLQPYIDDVLNELEYVLGDTSTPMGALRASYGHPEPWVVNMVEIGNEDNIFGGEPTYVDYRYQAFASAILAQYPDMKIIASALDIVTPGQAGDYHVYDRPDDFVTTQFNYFDQMAADSQYLMGEYATVQYNDPDLVSVDWSAPLNNHPFWEGSVAEAIYLIGGTERMSQKVIGASYAPTLCNNNSIQWGTNMIYFTADPSADVLSTSHHVVSLLSNTRMTNTYPITSDITTHGPLFYTAGENTDTGSYIFKGAVYNSTGAVPVTLSFAGMKAGTTAQLTVLTAPGPLSYAYEGYNPVVTTTTTVTADSTGAFDFQLPNLSVAVLSTGSGDGADTNYQGFGGYNGCKGGRKVVYGRGNGC